MNSRCIRQADDASLVRQVREHQDCEYAELRDAVQAGSAEDRRVLSARAAIVPREDGHLRIAAFRPLDSRSLRYVIGLGD